MSAPSSAQPAKKVSDNDRVRGRDDRRQRIKIMLHPGQLISADSLRLQRLEFLGKGGSGSVYRMMITDGPLRGLFVAVKFLEAVQDEKRVARFAEEIKILQELNHPHVVKILDLGTFGARDRETGFFVMEYHPRNLQRGIQAHPVDFIQILLYLFVCKSRRH